MIPGQKATFPTRILRDVVWASTSNYLLSGGWQHAVVFSVLYGCRAAVKYHGQAGFQRWERACPARSGKFCLQPVRPCSAQRGRSFVSAQARYPWPDRKGHGEENGDIYSPVTCGTWIRDPCECPASPTCSAGLRRWRGEISAAQAARQSPSWLDSCEVIAFVNRILLLLAVIGWSQAGLDSLCLIK